MSRNSADLIMRAITFILVLFHQLCFAALQESMVAGDWSPATNGLRGRLLLTDAPDSKYGVRNVIVYLELQNVALGDTMYVYYPASAGPLKCELVNSRGAAVSEFVSGSDWIPEPVWLALPHGSTLRFPTGNSAFGPTTAGIFIVSSFVAGTWFVPFSTNEFFLSGTFSAISTTNQTPNHSQNVWRGSLVLPKVKISAKRT